MQNIEICFLYNFLEYFLCIFLSVEFLVETVIQLYYIVFEYTRLSIGKYEFV